MHGSTQCTADHRFWLSARIRWSLGPRRNHLQIGWTRIQLREFHGPSDFSVIFPGYPGSPYYYILIVCRMYVKIQSPLVGRFLRADNPVRCTGMIEPSRVPLVHSILYTVSVYYTMDCHCHLVSTTRRAFSIRNFLLYFPSSRNNIIGKKDGKDVPSRVMIL